MRYLRNHLTKIVVSILLTLLVIVPFFTIHGSTQAAASNTFCMLEPTYAVVHGKHRATTRAADYINRSSTVRAPARDPHPPSFRTHTTTLRGHAHQVPLVHLRNRELHLSRHLQRHITQTAPHLGQAYKNVPHAQRTQTL